LLEEKKSPFGIVADRVVKMAKFEDPMGSPENSTVVDPQYTKGIVFDGNKEITILDFERLFHAR
jgi:chemotaxis signal transduction protein